jgi:hypothetical protein
MTGPLEAAAAAAGRKNHSPPIGSMLGLAPLAGVEERAWNRGSNT